MGIILYGVLNEDLVEGSTDGIGREVSIAQTTLDMSTIWGGIVLLGVLGVVLNLIFVVVEHHALACSADPPAPSDQGAGP